ncbi:MarR family winged helix-turn-helix transcriptional regulator [Telmatospirillum sp.]|uniref:MarR family winged helix-turn-helix transcriptional regulator n=1 Tax=Telmatospirillum sp. TaxID=2079197 RepID=UPI00284127F9|nr:MarR family winged helix-turn-helix transcriptional regulator [Telmatospirillum sp.]MDR3440624.1 MarR family winged helix-turn-helix transcriptional regulator [Telmatospirillum sp.]
MPDDVVVKGCTCFRLRRTTRKVTHLYDIHLQADGLTLTQYSLLSHLIRSPSPTIQQLAASMGMDRTSLTRTLAPLVARDMITIAPGDDRRSKIVQLTPNGRQIRDEAEGHWLAAQDEIAERLGANDLADLHRLLDRAFQRLS